ARRHDKTGNIDWLTFSNSDDVARPNVRISLFFSHLEIVDFEDGDSEITFFGQSRILKNVALSAHQCIRMHDLNSATGAIRPSARLGNQLVQPNPPTHVHLHRISYRS